MGIPPLARSTSLSHVSGAIAAELFATALGSSPLRVADVPGKGRGVIATRPIAAGELVERAAVIVVPAAQVAALERTLLDGYVYDWADGAVAVALGNGSLYNHSYRPNTRYLKDFASGTLAYVALADIAPGDELLINYNGDPKDQSPLSFAVVE